MRYIRRYWQWTIVSAGAAGAIVLGYWGLYEYFARTGQPRPLWDVAYFIVYLFVIESGEATGPVPWQLAAARLLAAGVAFWAVGKAGLVLYRERLQLARPARWRGHVVICGLGRKGLKLAKEFRAAGWRVAAIDRNPDNPAIASCRHVGVIVLVGDAAESAMLTRAGAARAKYVITVTGDDGVNIATAIKL
ncbi:MAG: NAD-binding protein, partial [Candidatus Hydrogenedentes bacterium]|nr:NAD-binding protein [Candidatus Hydrogenedentota bacterium]